MQNVCIRCGDCQATEGDLALGVSDYGVIGGLGGCGDLHAFRPAIRCGSVWAGRETLGPVTLPDGWVGEVVQLLDPREGVGGLTEGYDTVVVALVALGAHPCPECGGARPPSLDGWCNSCGGRPPH